MEFSWNFVGEFLTKELVNGAKPYSGNEIWISDSVIKGFGLRVWTNRSGLIRRHFGIRTTNQQGNSVRRSLCYEKALEYHYSLDHNDFYTDNYFGEVPKTLGDLTSSARTWAKNEILLLKKKGTTDEELAQNIREEKIALRNWVRERVRTYSFEKTCEVVHHSHL